MGASSQVIGGFEGASGAGWSNNFSAIAGTYKRSGSYGARSNPAGGSQGGNLIPHTPIAFASNDPFAGYGEIFCQVKSRPIANNSPFVFWNGSTVEMNTDGTWRIVVSGIGTVAGGSAIPMDAWVRIIIKHYTLDAGGNFGTQPASGAGLFCQHFRCEITNEDGSVSYGSLVTSGANLGVTSLTGIGGGCIAPNAPTYDMWWDDAKSLLATAVGSPGIGSITKWTEAKMGADGTLFAHSAIQGFLVTGQGSHDDFTPAGGFGNVDEIPKGTGGADDSVSAGVIGKITTYTKTALPTGQEVEAMTLRANAGQTGSNTHGLYLDNTDFDRTFSNTTAQDDGNTPHATIVYASSIPKATFDAIEIGLHVKNTVTLILHNIFLEALVGTEAVSANAGPDQSLNGVGFTTLAGTGTPFGSGDVRVDADQWPDYGGLQQCHRPVDWRDRPVHRHVCLSIDGHLRRHRT
jgi:hypothetical protein